MDSTGIHAGDTDGARALRAINAPRPIALQADASGAPRMLRKNGRWVAVVRVLDRYQTEDRWWTERPVSRDYYELLLADERVVSVFRDLIGGGWYEQHYG